MHGEAATILALLLSPGVGSVAIHRALRAARIAGRPLGDLLAAPASRRAERPARDSEDVIRDLARRHAGHQERASALLERLAQAGGRPVTVLDTDYPGALTSLLGDYAPPLLCVMGNERLLCRPMAGVVGARDPSGHGESLAAACAEVFCGAGIPVVSGGARGVDSSAHNAALACGGSTIVVLPQGLLTYPMPAILAEAAEEGRAAVISEFAPDAGWETHAAVTRNATISALARLVCVIEPKKTGGSIRTARCALDQGKTVLVHVGQGFEHVMRLLAKGGARDLFDGMGRFNPDYLLEAWHAASDPAPSPPYRPE